MNVLFLIIVLQLIFLEGILSIDNAAVLGAMVAHLPDDTRIIWPRIIQPFENVLYRLLGYQRTAALRVGLLGAYLGRGLMLVLANFVVRNPWLKVVGALYLVRLAFDNLSQAEPGEIDGHRHAVEVKSFWAVVLAVELADLVFSLDNVVAAVALSNQLWVVMLGVAIGILLMRFAAGWFSYAAQREPVLETAAYILVLAIGAELLLEELACVSVPDWFRFIISIVIVASSLAYAHLKPLQVFKPVLVWLAQGFGNFNEIFDWAFAPFFGLARWVGSQWTTRFASPKLPADANSLNKNDRGN
jgi:tellurite resistance protein TerC